MIDFSVKKRKSSQHLGLFQKGRKAKSDGPRATRGRSGTERETSRRPKRSRVKEREKTLRTPAPVKGIPPGRCAGPFG